MKVICIKKEHSLTVGKQYEVVSTRPTTALFVMTQWSHLESNQYVILNDHGINLPYCMSYFISLEDFRNKQIENILT